MNDNKTAEVEKKQTETEVKEKQTATYEVEMINRMCFLLNSIPIRGYNQVKSMSEVFDIIGSPIK